MGACQYSTSRYSIFKLHRDYAQAERYRNGFLNNAQLRNMDCRQLEMAMHQYPWQWQILAGNIRLVPQHVYPEKNQKNIINDLS